MNQQQIDEVIHRELLKATNGATVENPKFDFKREWYKLDTPDGVADFLCDTSAIANTVGLDGYIVIGYDDKENKFYPAPFSSTGLTDSSQMLNLIAKKVEPMYTVSLFTGEFQGHYISVLHIPPSINKPHVIRSYIKKGKEEEQRIFVRKSSVNHRANRYDIELMYYDRKNIIPDYSLLISFHAMSIRVHKKWVTNIQDMYTLRFPITIENLGRRPVSISKLSFVLAFSKIFEEDAELPVFITESYRPLLIPIGGICNHEFQDEWYVNKPEADKQGKLLEKLKGGAFRDKLNLLKARAQTTSGEEFSCEMGVGH